MLPNLDEADRRALAHLADATLTFLSLVFVGLLIVEYTVRLSPSQARWLELAGLAIWAVFTTDFFVRLALARHKPTFIRSNWLAGLAVLLPAVRVVRVLRVLRAARTLRLARLITTANRGIRALRRTITVGASAYVAALTIVLLLLSAAGMTTLERGADGASITSFGTALWWAITTLTTIGSDLQPVTLEGRLLSILVMVLGLGLAGYITARVAALLLGRAQDDTGAQIAALRAEVLKLRTELARHPGAGAYGRWRSRLHRRGRRVTANRDITPTQRR